VTKIEHTLTIDRPVDEVWDYLMDAQLTGSPVPGRGSYELEPVGDGTRLRAMLETDAHGFFKLAEPVFARMARRDFAGNFETLKDLLESRNDFRTDGP
jgi:hypothetical protein